MSYTLGLDIGNNSVGFAGINHQKNKILFCGAHMFDAAENPLNGQSLNLVRRERRSKRRVIKRKSARKRQIRALLHKHGFKQVDEIDKSTLQPTRLNPWQLRKAALERKLSDGEFARVLFHIAKRRGHQANYTNTSDDSEGKRVIEGARFLKEQALLAGAKTVSAYLANQPKQRNGFNDYSNSIIRETLREEVGLIFEAQRVFGNPLATQELEDEYAGNGLKQDRGTLAGEGLAFFQRSYQSSEEFIGDCPFEVGEKRAPKYSYTAELFLLWCKLNRTTIQDHNGDDRKLGYHEKNRLIYLVHKNKAGVSYKQARKELGLSDYERFNIRYEEQLNTEESWLEARDKAEKSRFLSVPGFHTLKEIFGQEGWTEWVNDNRNAIDEIARIISFIEDKIERRSKLGLQSLSDTEINQLNDIYSFRHTVDISLKAIHRLLPELHKGLSYDEACKAVGYSRIRQNTQLNGRLLPPFQDLKNPVVNRSFAQMRKIVNACIRQHGMPKEIVISLKPGFGLSYKDRKQEERSKRNWQEYLKKAKAELSKSLKIPESLISDEHAEKYNYWKRQSGICPYSGESISLLQLLDEKTSIDHIIPFKRCWDNSFMNKVLCLSQTKRKKAGKTPYEFLSKTPQYKELKAFAAQQPYSKGLRLLMKNFIPKKEKDWKYRAFQDQSYLALLLKDQIETTLSGKRTVVAQARKPQIIKLLKEEWNLGAIEENLYDRSPALEAIIAACSKYETVQKVSDYVSSLVKTKQALLPWKTFKSDTQKALQNIFVSRLPRRNVKGPAHEDTLRSIRKTDGKAIQRVKLTSLSPLQLERLVDKERNVRLFNLLKTRLEANNNKPELAFSEPIYMPVNNPEKVAPRINSVRILTHEKSGIIVNQGLASNGNMVRLDVFFKDGKYHIVPIYTYHMMQSCLPNKAIISGREEADWIEISDEYFIFSLYKNDLVRIKSKKEDLLGYYHSTARSTGSIAIRAPDNNPEFGTNGVKQGIGTKRLIAFEKYNVDYFGNKHKVHKEKRLGVINARNPLKVPECANS